MKYVHPKNASLQKHTLVTLAKPAPDLYKARRAAKLTAHVSSTQRPWPAHLIVLHIRQLPLMHSSSTHPVAPHQHQRRVCRVNARRCLHSRHLPQPPGDGRCHGGTACAAAAHSSCIQLGGGWLLLCCWYYWSLLLQVRAVDQDKHAVQQRQPDAELLLHQLLQGDKVQQVVCRDVDGAEVEGRGQQRDLQQQ